MMLYVDFQPSYLVLLSQNQDFLFHMTFFSNVLEYESTRDSLIVKIILDNKYLL